MNVLIVVPRYAKRGQFYSWLIGLASIYAFLKREGVSVSCLNLCHDPDNDTRASLERAFARNPFDIVCSGGMSFDWEKVEDIFSHAKLVRPDVITVAGGTMVTGDPELVLRHMSIDFGVSGEGEYTLMELLETLQNGSAPDTVKGLAFIRKNGNFVFTGARKVIKDLDQLPMPEYEDFGFREWTSIMKYAGRMSIVESFDEARYAEMIGSRSCPFSCTFCFNALGNTYRKRSLNHVFTEIDYLYKNFGVNVFNFGDQLFSASNKRMLEFAERIRPYNVKYCVQLRVNNVQQDVLEKMVESGLINASFGIESMSNTVLKSMKKKITKAETITALETARKAGLYCTGNIIIGDPADTIETINESISWWRENPIYNVTLSFICAAPNSEVYRYGLEKGIIKDKWEHVKNHYPFVNLTKVSNRYYYNLLLKVTFWNFMNSNIVAGTLLNSKKLNEVYNGKHFYLLETRCPFCGSEQKYKKFIGFNNPNLTIVCLKCFASFKIQQKRAFFDDYSYLSMIKYFFFKMGNVFLMRFAFGKSILGKLRALYDLYFRDQYSHTSSTSPVSRET